MTTTTRNRIKLSENQVALIWQQLIGREMVSVGDERIKIIYPGRINGDSGPDFRDAVIINGADFMQGDVEIHVNCNDWYNHGHHHDAEYNNVILHVVVWHDSDQATLLQNGKSIPMLCLPKALQNQAYLLPYYQLPCFQIQEHIDRQTLGKLLANAGEDRFKQKAVLFQTELEWEEAKQVFWRGMMRALGYAKNANPFEELARKMPLSFIESRNDLALKQALLLGTAGLLPSQRMQGISIKGMGIQELEQIWQSEGEEARTMKKCDWHLTHVYPNNSPVRRIIAQSHLLQRYCKSELFAGILQLVKEVPLPAGHRVLEDGLTITSEGYWRDHFDFDVRCKTKTSALLGRSKAGEIIVNVILPFTLSWGKMTNDLILVKKAIELYKHYPKLTENQITRHMVGQLCLEDISDFTACHQQGLIYIFKNNCREGKCSLCPLAS